MLPVFEICEGMTLHSYPFFLGISVAYLVSSFLRINKKQSVVPNRLESLFIIFLLISLAFLGAKFTFIVSSKKVINLSNGFWLGGGLVFYGGYIFALSGIYLYSLIRGIKTTLLVSFLPTVIFAHAIGRVGCFFAGCCHGRYCPLAFLERWPTQLFEVTFLLILGFRLKKRIEQNKKNNFYIYVLAYSIFRFLNEFLRGDEIRGIWYLGMSTSQIVSLVLFVSFGLAYLKETFSTNSSDT